MTELSQEARVGGVIDNDLLALFKCRSVGETFSPSDSEARRILFDRITTQAKRIERLEAALRPFKRFADLVCAYDDFRHERGLPQMEFTIQGFTIEAFRMIKALGDADV